MSSSNVQYQGTVTIRVKNKPPVKRKNNGTTRFFEVLNMLLCQTLFVTGDTNRDAAQYYNSLPGFITAVKLTEGVPSNDYSEVTHIFSSEMPIVIKNIIYKQGLPSTSFKAILNASNIPSEIAGYVNCYMVLLDGAKKNILAYVPLVGDTLQAIIAIGEESDMQGEIEWTLTFSNPTSNDII